MSSVTIATACCLLQLVPRPPVLSRAQMRLLFVASIGILDNLLKVNQNT